LIPYPSQAKTVYKPLSYKWPLCSKTYGCSTQNLSELQNIPKSGGTRNAPIVSADTTTRKTFLVGKHTSLQSEKQKKIL